MQSFQLRACLTCRSTVTAGMTYRRIRNASDTEMQIWGEEICVNAQIETRKVCSDVTKIFTPLLLFIMDSNPDLTAYDFCAIVYQGEDCGTPRHEKFHFEVDIVGEAPEITVRGLKSSEEM